MLVSRLIAFVWQRRTALLSLLVVALAAAVLISWDPFGGGAKEVTARFPAGGPAEFLYLDKARVIAYLAQMEGGTFTTETLTSKIARSGSGKLAVDGVGEIGGSRSEENSLARDLTPTAAADYFEFLRRLESSGGLKTIGLGRFERDVAPIKEGQFVLFDSHGLRPPVYVNPYLALHQPTTFASIYPTPKRSRLGIVRGRRQRRRAFEFRRRVGHDPRIVLAVRPYDESELQRISHGDAPRPEKAGELEAELEAGRGEIGEGSSEAAARTEIAARRDEEMRHVIYLMPMNARLFTRERSLVKAGGGEFTVVGKVVRVFPEKGEEHGPAYVDSLARETWEKPLAEGPARLICRTDPRCIREEDEHEGVWEPAIEAARRRDHEALVEATTIAERGAVILPVAIYK